MPKYPMNRTRLSGAEHIMLNHGRTSIPRVKRCRSRPREKPMRGSLPVSEVKEDSV